MEWSSSASSSSPPFEAEQDVFLSFNGETRCNFTSHLVGALRRRNIRTCVDDNIRRGKNISSALAVAIRNATVSLIIFSENYAASKWCLMETTKIIECHRTQKQIVIPIFYHIDPTDVRNQTGSYAEAFMEHDLNNLVDLEKVERWRTALRTAANLSGWHCRVNHMEYEFVEMIADEVMERVNRRRKHILEERMDTEIANDVMQTFTVEEKYKRMLHELYKENILTVVQILHLWEMAKAAHFVKENGKPSEQRQEITRAIEEFYYKNIGKGCCFPPNVRIFIRKTVI